MKSLPFLLICDNLRANQACFNSYVLIHLIRETTMLLGVNGKKVTSKIIIIYLIYRYMYGRLMIMVKVKIFMKF